MSNATKHLSNFYNTITNTIYTGKDESTHTLIDNTQILRIGNTLSGLFSEAQSPIKPPRIVVVGTQSAGKSSVLNNILEMELMPTGKQMVTRTPINLQLINSSESKTEFGNYQDGIWQSKVMIPLSQPDPTKEEICQIKEQIEKQTIEKAGNNKNITSHEIVIKVYSPKVPDLNLIDLPGLTMVACTDKGQPADIKDRIRRLVSSYIAQERTIILAVIAARVDLEADMALELIKHHDPEGERTVGVLTKVDLMNTDSHIGSYITQNISKDLQLKYGYFAVRNKALPETSISDGYLEEKNYYVLKY